MLSSSPTNARTAGLALAALAVFLDTLGYQLVVPALPAFSERLTLSASEAGLLYAAYGLASVPLYIPLGLLVDRLGARGFVIAGLALLSAASAAFALADTYGALLVSRLVQGAGAAVLWTGAIPWVAGISGEDSRGSGLAIVPAAFTLGLVLGPAFGGLGGLKAPFAVFAVFPALAAMGLLVLRSGSRVERAPRPLRALLRNRGVWLAGFAVMAGFALVGAMEVLVPAAMHGHGASKLRIGILFAVVGAVSAGSHVLSGMLSDRFGRAPLIIIGLAVSALAALVLPRAEGPLLWLVAALLVVGLSAVLAPTLPLIADAVPASQWGLGYGIYNTLFSVGVVVGPFAAGHVADRYSLQAVGVLFCGILLATGLVCAVIGRLGRKAVFEAEPAPRSPAER